MLDNMNRSYKERIQDEKFSAWMVLGAMLMCGLILLVHGCTEATASEYTTDQIVNAIGKAENSKTHPYGIMVKYKTTTPRQACVNTVNHKRRDWIASGSKGDFIDYLGDRYAPTKGATNDPTNLNVNWKKNVRYFLSKGETK